MLFAPLLLCITAVAADPESAADARARHERVAERRTRVNIICHRGASEFAWENTLEAYRASFELGADGNEIDIRRTKDGVLVCFHDDMLDRILDIYGDASEVTWADLQRARFRSSGRFGDQCRIPTLGEVLQLHKKHAGLLHLDIKRAGLDESIAELLTKLDMWDHVAFCNTETAGVILKDPRYKPRRYKGGLYLDHGEVFPDAIAEMLKKPGDDVIVDDPRGVALALGRMLGPLSKEPVERVKPAPDELKPLPAEKELLASLAKPGDSGEAIRARALAAEQLLLRGAKSKEAFAALEDRVRNRTLHKDWMFHGFDGAMALRSLLLLKAPQAADVARFTLWRDDPALEPVIDPRFKNPRSWTDFRVKMVVFPALAGCPGAASEKLCRDYLALTDGAAKALGPPQFEEAARALLAISPKTGTATELMSHRLQVVRGRAVLMCLARIDEPWAKSALEKSAPHALKFAISP